ncbi:MAG TPA: hypothetical protein VFZ61_06020 [Polyangiales bacterium]
MKRRWLLWLSCLSLSCAGAPKRAAHSAPTVGPEAHADLVGIGLAAAAQELLADGYRPSAEPEQGFLAPAMRTVSRVEVPPRSCLAIAAAATPSLGDLDAALYADDGAVLAEDDSANPRPVLRLCSADRPISGHLALVAFQGAGSYALQRFVKPLGAADAPEPHSGDGAASAAFLELLRSLRARGYQQEAPLVQVPLAPGTPLRVALRALAGHCYSVVADSADARLVLLNRRGEPLSQGVSADGPAALQHCVSQDDDLTLELSATSQQGGLRLARLWAQQSAVGGARSLWLGEPAPAGFDAPRTAKAAERPARCETRALALATALPLNQGAVWDAALAPQATCVSIEAELHAGLSRVTLRIEDAGGATLDRGDLTGSAGSLYACSKRTPLRVSAIARAGFGAITVKSRACRE